MSHPEQVPSLKTTTLSYLSSTGALDSSCQEGCNAVPIIGSSISLIEASSISIRWARTVWVCQKALDRHQHC